MHNCSPLRAGIPIQQSADLGLGVCMYLKSGAKATVDLVEQAVSSLHQHEVAPMGSLSRTYRGDPDIEVEQYVEDE